MKHKITIAFLCTAILLASCGSKHENENEGFEFFVTSPAQMDTFITRDYVCQIQSIRHIEIRSQEKGYLQNIFIDEGKHVQQGQVLFQIMPNLYNAELQKAEAEVNLAQVEYQNTKTLADKNVVSVNELAMAKAKLDKAKAELALMQVHVQFTTIKAPFSGIIDRFHARLGSLIDEGDLLTNLSDNSEMWVYFNVPEAEYLNLKSKSRNDSLMKVQLLMANNERFKYSGIVKTIEADFNNETGNIAFRATFPNPDGLLRHGETGNIEMKVPLNDAVIIPQKATFEVLEKKYVFVVEKDNTVHLREINIGAEMPDLYVITSGLKKGEKFLLEGIRKVQDKDKIAYKYKDPKEVIQNLKVYVE